MRNEGENVGKIRMGHWTPHWGMPLFKDGVMTEWSKKRWTVFLPVFCFWIGLGATFGAPPPISIPVDYTSLTNPSEGVFGFMDGINRSSYLFGDLWGLRTFLSRYGMTLSLQETSECLGNATGGIQQGATYDGLTQGVLQMDTSRAFGLRGGLLNVSGLFIHGVNLSPGNLDVLQTASGIEADDGVRFWEIWYDQKFFDSYGVSRFDIKLGQQSLDQEFMDSINAAYFVNTMFGWPMVPSADLPGGGPAYPLSALGARLQWKPVDGINILGGVYNGSPAPTSAGDPQQADPHGLSFPLNGGLLAIAEIQYSYPSLGDMVYSSTPALSGTYRLGFWYNTENFADERYDDQGLSQANPASDGNPLNHSGDYSIYGVADQMIWRSAKDPNRTLSFFARAMWAPEDRNLIDFSVNAGFVLKDPFTYRTDDVFGLAMGYAHVSPAVAGLASDTAFYDPGAFSPQPSGETFVEATYQYFVFPWFQLQPDVQYFFNPGGGVENPNSPGQLINNELVLGTRAILQL